MRQIPQERRRKKHGWKMETILFLIDNRMCVSVCICVERNHVTNTWEESYRREEFIDTLESLSVGKLVDKKDIYIVDKMYFWNCINNCITVDINLF